MLSFFELCYAFHEEYVCILPLEKLFCNGNGTVRKKSVEICRENNYAKRKICKKMKKFRFFCNEMGKK